MERQAKEEEEALLQPLRLIVVTEDLEELELVGLLDQ